LLKGVISDDKGVFKFENLVKGTYLIRVNYIGYQSKTIEIDTEKPDFRSDLSVLTLSPLSQLLEAVVVAGQKPVVVTTLEKKVFKSDQFEVAKGGTATDVLRNIPSITLNAEGEITMRGSKGFLVLVNGKPSQIDIATLLAQIPANSIDKIEMITAPSAKYDADGKAGIINIITKSGATDGFSVITNGQIGMPRINEYYNLNEPQRYGLDATLMYKKGKWDVSVSGNYLRNDIAGRREGDVNTIFNQFFNSFPSEGERSYKRYNYGLRSLIAYKIDKQNELSAGVYVGKRTQYRRADITYFDNIKAIASTREIIAATTYYNPNLVLKDGLFKVFNLDYTHTFANSANLILSSLYEQADLEGFTSNANLNRINLKDTLQYTYNTGANPLNALRLKADYEQTIGIGKLTMGYQFRNQTQEGQFLYQEKSGSFTPLITNQAFSANINVLNRIHAVYAQYAGKIKRIEFSGGLRYENSFREFKDNKGSKPAILELSNLFPSANILLDLGKDYRAKLAYSRRVQRSTNNELNPYPEREHSETLEQGDPNIRPEFIGISEIGITKDFKKGSLFWNFYSQNITDIVNRVNSVYNDTILNRVYTNAGKALLLGSEIGFTYSPIKKVKVFVGGNIYNLAIQGTLFNDQVAVNSKGWVYSINSNISWQIGKTLSSQFNVSYLSARVTAQGEDSKFYAPNLSLKKTFLNNKITATAQWQNMAFGNMEVNQQRITTFGKDFFTTTNYIQETNILMLNLSYSFNQSNRKAKLPNSEFGEKEY
jgi:ferric enterobactin receptor